MIESRPAPAADTEYDESLPLPPHGGRLVNRLAEVEARPSLWEEAAHLPAVSLTPRQLSDLEQIALGAFSPLEGFMGEADYRSVLHEMHLADGTAWSLPITLAAARDVADGLKLGENVALVPEGGEQPIAVLALSEKYDYDKREEARLAYRTEDENHPGVAAVYRQPEVLLAGKITLLELPSHAEFGDLCRPPAATRRIFWELGWRRVVGFQTRNPIHRAHEYLQKCALEIVNGLLIHPLVGETKDDDIPSDVRLRCYHALIDDYFPRGRVLLSLWPAAMRYAGPREAIFHALVRKNYGCTHFIVGRDHAGVGSYYGTYDAQRIFDEFTPEELGIMPLCFEHAFYCRGCGAMATPNTCPHDATKRVTLSGTKVREMLAAGELPPPEFTRPEIARILLETAKQTAG